MSVLIEVSIRCVLLASDCYHYDHYYYCLPFYNLLALSLGSLSVKWDSSHLNKWHMRDNKKVSFCSLRLMEVLSFHLRNIRKILQHLPHSKRKGRVMHLNQS